MRTAVALRRESFAQCTQWSVASIAKRVTTRRYGGSTGGKTFVCVVRLLTMVRHRNDEGELVLFQARKRYGEWYVFEGKRLYKDWARALVHGWVRVSATGVSMLPATGVFEDDDGKQGFDL